MSHSFVVDVLAQALHELFASKDGKHAFMFLNYTVETRSFFQNLEWKTFILMLPLEGTLQP